MNLQKLYNETKIRVDQVDFESIWTGFSPLKFALYNQHECVFDGCNVPKTNDFIANTAILYQNEYIAIWQVTDEEDPDILASKIIHEMFHGFQSINHEARFPNEWEALMHYRNSAENLSIKLAENNLIVNLIHDFHEEIFQELLRLRKYRQIHFPYEFRYEAQVEQIEGSANYVELEALRQISPAKYQKTTQILFDHIVNPQKMIPVRIISYAIGGLMLQLLKKQNKTDFMNFSNISTAEAMLADTPAYRVKVELDRELIEIIKTDNQLTDDLIDQTLEANNCIVSGEFELQGFNVYNARFSRGYIVTTYFVAYLREGKVNVLNGDFVIEVSDNLKVKKIYQITDKEALS